MSEFAGMHDVCSMMYRPFCPLHSAQLPLLYEGNPAAVLRVDFLKAFLAPLCVVAAAVQGSPAT